MLIETLRAQRETILALGEHYGARHLRVFGSVARGEEGPDSDVDFLVEFPRGYDLFGQRLPLTDIISKVWNFCTTLRDDGGGYGDYLEQLTYLIFLKMADEYAQPPYNRDVGIPEKYNWQSLKAKRGRGAGSPLRRAAARAGHAKGMLGQIFTKAQNKIQDPAKLYRLIDMVDAPTWVMMGADVKGDIYEGCWSERRGHQVRAPASTSPRAR
jgi:predicted nucleotidyltransferase